MAGFLAATSLWLPAGPPARAAEWWDDFPRIVSDASAQQGDVVLDLHGTVNMNANGQDPGWGTFFQRDGIVRTSARVAALKSAGLRQVGYFETFGTTYCPVAELGAWDGTNLTPVLKTHWSWQNYGGGPVRWLGSKNFFDDEDFARPYTRTHPRYGGPPMEYPDGTVAAGYAGDPADPRNSRVYDAGCSKDVFGNLSIQYTDIKPGEATNGLVVNPATGNHASFVMFKKDSACPFWIDYTYASTLQAADAGIDGMWSDNYGPWDSFGNPPVRHGFGDWSVARFRSHLSGSFSSGDLAAMGVEDPAVFDIRAHLRGKALGWGWDGANLSAQVWKKAEWTDDPLWRAYAIFKRQAGTEALSNYYAAVKSAALAAGNSEFLVQGNDIPGFSMGWCRGDLDMVSTELSLGWKLSNGATGFTPPPTGRYAPFYKLAREHARGRFVGIWLYNDHFAGALARPATCKALYYEMLATHTLPKFHPSSSRIAGDHETNAGFFAFVEEAAPRFGRRRPVEDVGVYYSSSSILRAFTPGGFQNMSSQPHQFAFWGWATALGELHLQYRAVPEWKLDPETLASLRLLVVPDAEVLDPAGADLLAAWVAGGGRLVVTGESGKYLGEAGNFATNPAGWSLAALTNHANVAWLPGNLGMDYYLAYGNRPALLPGIEAIVQAALAGAPTGRLVAADAPSTAGITLFEDEAAGKLFIDINNMEIDTNTWQAVPTGTISVELALPPWMRGASLHATVLSPQAVPPAIGLEPAASNTLAVSIGPVEHYAGIVIANEWGVWREAHFSPGDVQSGLADADADPDGDGFSNWQEFIAGTDPNDAASRLLLQGGLAEGAPELSFATATGRIYSVFSSTNLAHGAWRLLETVEGTGGTETFAGGEPAPAAFYRLEAMLP